MEAFGSSGVKKVVTAQITASVAALLIELPVLAKLRLKPRHCAATIRDLAECGARAQVTNGELSGEAA
jgi:hypothetical protein